MGLQAVELYRRMPRALINEFTHICVLNACSHSGLVEEERSIFNQIEQKIDKIYTTMVIGGVKTPWSEHGGILLGRLLRTFVAH